MSRAADKVAARKAIREARYERVMMSTALNLSKGTEFKNEAEAVIRSSHRLTALSDTVLTERTD